MEYLASERTKGKWCRAVLAAGVALLTGMSTSSCLHSRAGEGPPQWRIATTLRGAADPAWSPSGAWLAFRTDEPGRPWLAEIYLRAMKENRTLRVTYNNAYDGEPAFSPDGRRLLFTSTLGGEAELLIVDLGELDELAPEATPIFRPRQITSLGGENGAFSPDGARVAFVSKREGIEHVYERHMETGRVVRQTVRPLRHLTPTYSPEGRWLIYAAEGGAGSFDLWARRLDGASTNPRRLTRLPGHALHPTVTSQGHRLCFTYVPTGVETPIPPSFECIRFRAAATPPAWIDDERLLTHTYHLTRARFDPLERRLAGALFDKLRWNIQILRLRPPR